MATDDATTYEVHLAADVADQLDVDSPLRTDRIDYYDSGFWITRPEGRDFFPYGEVLTIRERTGTTAEEEAEEPGEVEGSEPAGSGMGEPSV